MYDDRSSLDNTCYFVKVNYKGFPFEHKCFEVENDINYGNMQICSCSQLHAVLVDFTSNCFPQNHTSAAIF